MNEAHIRERLRLTVLTQIPQRVDQGQCRPGVAGALQLSQQAQGQHQAVFSWRRLICETGLEIIYGTSGNE
jgi:hypothetical protein